MKKFGLIGKNISYSKSKELFDELVGKYSYEIIDTDTLNKELLLKYDGLNITKPYKLEVIQYLDEVDEKAKEINSINCIVNDNGKLKGYNTDICGIEKSLQGKYSFAIVFGNGGVSKTIEYFLKCKGIEYIVVGRSGYYDISYEELKNTELIKKADLLINCTPLGTYPNTDKVDIQYEQINCCTVFDLVYNPKETPFLKECKKSGCECINGEIMLREQAISSYVLWKII